VVRTKAHDNFGLGVLVFQLLFMGRHPYAGQQKGSDLSLDQMIAGNLFAYSRRRQTGVTPPGVLPSLDDFPADLADGFERAFGLDPGRRPSAGEWVNLLQGLERQLSRCGVDQMHYFPSKAKQCPWCRMEAATGAVLFLSTAIANGSAAIGLGNFDVEKAWTVIKAVVLPAPNAVLPKLPSFNPGPSADAQAAKSVILQHKLFGGVVAVAAIAAWAYMPDVWPLCFGALMVALFQFGGATARPTPNGTRGLSSGATRLAYPASLSCGPNWKRQWSNIAASPPRSHRLSRGLRTSATTGNSVNFSTAS
jgi:hypothetical protein